MRTHLGWPAIASGSAAVRDAFPEASSNIKVYDDFVSSPVRPAEAFESQMPQHFAGTSINTLGLAAGQRFPITLHAFADVYFGYTTRGFLIFDGGGVSRFSSALPLFETAEGPARMTEHIDAGFFCGDIFNKENVCHYTLDQLGRCLLYREAAPAPLPLVMPKATLDYNRTTRAAVLGDYIEIEPDRIYHFGRLDILSSSLHPIDHPARYCDGRIMSAIIAGLSDQVRHDDGPRRIYVSRADAKTRRIANEDKLRENLEARGFQTVMLSQLPPAEQLTLFGNADLIVAPHGAGLTSLIMSRPGTKVVELFNPSKGTAAFAAIAEYLALSYRPLFGEPNPQNGDFIVPTMMIDEALDRASRPGQ